MNMDINHNSFNTIINQVKAGQTVTMEENGKPAAILTLTQNMPSEERKPGAMKGKIHIKDNIDDPLSNEIAAAFGKDNC